MITQLQKYSLSRVEAWTHCKSSTCQPMPPISLSTRLTLLFMRLLQVGLPRTEYQLQEYLHHTCTAWDPAATHPLASHNSHPATYSHSSPPTIFSHSSSPALNPHSSQPSSQPTQELSQGQGETGGQNLREGRDPGRAGGRRSRLPRLRAAGPAARSTEGSGQRDVDGSGQKVGGGSRTVLLVTQHELPHLTLLHAAVPRCAHGIYRQSCMSGQRCMHG